MIIDTAAAERQKAVYTFLLGRGDKWTPMSMVTDAVSYYPTFYTGTYHNSSARRMLTSDIEDINNSRCYEIPIISGSKGIKIPTEAEFKKFIEAEFREVFRKLSAVRKLAAKGRLNGQYEIDGHAIDAFLQEEAREDA